MTDSIHQQAFLFMPDISGFTKFIDETEIEHSTHIIRELLETIISENKLGMKVIEIEGDAVFFYRLNFKPTIEDIISQSRHIFERFHQHLLKYENRRICQCGACRTANKLTVKFIAHTGYVSSYSVHKHFKLIGKDVIILHRLLKSSVADSEYLLFTEPFFEEIKGYQRKPMALSFKDQSDLFDGSCVRYKYASIGHWLNEVAFPDDDNLNEEPDTLPLVTVSDEIEAPAEILFSYIADLSRRIEWLSGVNDIQITSGSSLNQTGAIHKCTIDDSGASAFKTGYYEHQGNYMSFIEAGINGNSYSHQFTVEKKSNEKSVVIIRLLVRNTFMQKAFFNLFMKKKIEKRFLISVENLKSNFLKYRS